MINHACNLPSSTATTMPLNCSLHESVPQFFTELFSWLSGRKSFRISMEQNTNIQYLNIILHDQNVPCATICIECIAIL